MLQQAARGSTQRWRHKLHLITSDHGALRWMNTYLRGWHRHLSNVIFFFFLFFFFWGDFSRPLKLIFWSNEGLGRTGVTARRREDAKTRGRANEEWDTPVRYTDYIYYNFVIRLLTQTRWYSYIGSSGSTASRYQLGYLLIHQDTASMQQLTVRISRRIS